jgi:glyoxylase-like metal-dependent hydrolase (beta-lactamase superfamily II)
MAEPRETATEFVTVTQNLVRWSVNESRIGNMEGEAYALVTPAGQVMIDPLPLTEPALAALQSRGPIAAILLTIQSHQRAAWRYAKDLNVPVYAPQGSQGLEGHWLEYQESEPLPGGLSAIALPGPAFSGHGFVWQSVEGRVLFCGDLLSSRPDGSLHLVPDRYMDSPALARASVRKLLGQTWAILCPGHGAPVHGHSSELLQALLQREAKPPVGRRLFPPAYGSR